MSTVRQILKNTATGWISVLVRAALGIITIPFLLKALGADGLGLIAILGTIVGLSTVIDLGLRSALGQTLAEQVSLRNNEAFNQIITTALLLYILMSVLCAAVIYITAPGLVGILNVSEKLTPTAISLIRLYGTIAILISFITPVFSAAIQSNQRFDIVNTLQASTAVFSNATIIVAISISNFYILDWVVIMLFTQIASLLLLVIAFKKICRENHISLTCINFKRLLPLFNLGGYMYLIQLSATISDQSNPLILSGLSNMKSVGIYQPALSISQALTPFVMTLTSQLYPTVTKYHLTGNSEGIKKIFIFGARYTLLLGVLFSSGTFFFADSFAKLWLSPSIGDDYLIVAELMRLFVIIDLLTYASGTQWPILLGMRQLKYLTWLLLSTAILNICTSIYLVAYTNLGVTGVLYGTIISKVIRVLALNRYVFKLVGVGVSEYLKVSIFKPALCLILTGSFAWLLVENFNSETWGELLCLSGATFLAWAIIVWLSCLTTDEKSAIRQGKFKALTS